MKIIIPMAGMGSRLRPHSLTTPKPLTIIAGKSIVQRLVEEIAKVVKQEIEEIAFIIGPASKGFPADSENHLKEIANGINAKARVFVQEEALGNAHAIQCAKEVLTGPCVVAFADTLFRADFTMNESADGVILVKQVEDPSAFGVVNTKDGYITEFVEKPDDFVSDLAIIGIYYFKNAAIVRDEIQYLIDNNITDKGEFQLTNALENMKQKGMKFVPGEVEEWMDCGNKKDTVDTNAKVLTLLHKEGRELVSESVVLENATIIPPCYIGENVVLKNTAIGPNVSLGANSIVESSRIDNSLIQSNVKIESANLSNAMIGHHAKYNGKYTSVSIGDYSELV